MLVAPLDNTLDQAQARPPMTQPQRRAWTMVASMFVTVAIVYGLSFDIIGLFYNSLAKEFVLSRAKFSSLATSFSLSFLVGGLVAGWMLDRIGAQFVVVGGAMVVIAGLLVASTASSFNAMLLAYFLIVLGVSAAINNVLHGGQQLVQRRTHTCDGCHVLRALGGRAGDGMDRNLFDRELRLAQCVSGVRGDGVGAGDPARPHHRANATGRLGDAAERG